MSDATVIRIPRRVVLKQLGAATLGTLLLKPHILMAEPDLRIAGHLAEISVFHVSAHTVRIRIAGRESTTPIPDDGALVADLQNEPHNQAHRSATNTRLRIKISREPLIVQVADSHGHQVQQLQIDENTGSVTFPLGDAPLLAWVKVDRNLIAVEMSTICAADKAVIACVLMVGAFPCSGSSGLRDGQCSSINPSEALI